MTKDSISSKLTELFGLLKSGALTQEEYETLKQQILSEHGVKNIVPEKEQELEEVKPTDKANQIEAADSVEKQKLENVIPEDKLIQVERATSEKEQELEEVMQSGKPIQVNKKRRLWIFSIIVGVCIIAFVILKLTLFSNKSDVTDLQEQIVKDIDGNVYHTVTIGTQVWMVENLKTTKYNDGTPIPLVTDNTSWRALTTPAYCWYNNDEITNRNTYGALYNWYAVNTNKLCPTGWHVPSDSEWTILTDYLINNGNGYLGSGDDIGKSLASTTGWNVSSEIGAVGNNPSNNNKSGFSAFASGIRFSNGEFRHGGQNGKWWSSTETSAKAAQIRFISWDDGILTSYSNRKENGFSVRCVKDNGDYDAEIVNKDKPKSNEEAVETTAITSNDVVEKENNIVSNVKRDPRRKDIANVFWNPKYTLFCKLTDEPISPNNEGKYDIWYSSHEDPQPYHKIFSKSELPDFLFYKFKDYETCKKWCDAKNQPK